MFPLLLGGLIYVGWRDQNLPMFRWFDLVGLGPLVQQLRVATAPLKDRLPFWFRFSLPDAMWVYALTAFMMLVWKEASSRMKVLWISMGLLLGAGSELGQLAGYVPGRFDIFDFVLCICAAGLALVFTSRSINFKRSMNEAAT